MLKIECQHKPSKALQSIVCIGQLVPLSRLIQIISSMEQLTCLDVPFDDAVLHEVGSLRITTIFHEDCGLCWCDMAFLPSIARLTSRTTSSGLAVQAAEACLRR